MPELSLMQVFLVTLASAVAAAGVMFFLWNRLSGQGFALIVGLGLFLRMAFAVFTPPFQAPDEQAHFLYIQYLAVNQQFPVQTAVTGDETHAWEYHQPPLYYLLLAGPMWVLQWLGLGPESILIWLRVWGLGFWLGQMALLRRMLTAWGWNDAEAMGVISVWAFLPSAVFLSAMVNNDQLALFFALAVVWGAKKMHQSGWNALACGVLFGLGLLSKLSLITMGVFFPVLTRYEHRWEKVPWLRTALVLGVAGILFSPWAWRNQILYGSFTAEAVAFPPFEWPQGWVQALWESVYFLLHSFFAGAGVYQQIGFPFWMAGAAVVFWAAWAGRNGRAGDEIKNSQQGLLLAGGVVLAVQLVLVLRIGLLYGQAQGRFVYPVLWVMAAVFTRLILAVLPDSRWQAAGWWLYAATFTGYALAMMTRIAPGSGLI